ncbi:MAG: D-2-hydroxyacid dehydrogenase [Planctomycetaceae bacterium]
MKLLIHPAIDGKRLGRVQEVAGAMSVVNADSMERALHEISAADVFFGKLTPELLKQASQLKWVQSPTASLEHYLFPELIAHPCQLSNMRGLFSDVIADHVMGFVLCFARNLHHYLDLQRLGRWEPIGGEQTRPDFATGPGNPSDIDRAHMHLADASLGVIGVGHIGSEICRRAAAFGMTISGIDPVCRSVPGVLETVWPTDQLDRLLAASDFVVISAPHTPQTEKLIGMRQLKQMRKSSILINIGRGVIVDLRDLTQALHDGVIAGAALDVYETEPLPTGHPLWSMQNVILTPHIAAASPRIAERHTQTFLDNLQRFRAGEPPLTLVDKSLWY